MAGVLVPPPQFKTVALPPGPRRVHWPFGVLKLMPVRYEAVGTFIPPVSIKTELALTNPFVQRLLI